MAWDGMTRMHADMHGCMHAYMCRQAILRGAEGHVLHVRVEVA